MVFQQTILPDMIIKYTHSISAADKVPRAWPPGLWTPLKLEPVIAQPMSVSPAAREPDAPTKLQTNDEALVENKDVARLVNVADMTPAM